MKNMVTGYSKIIQDVLAFYEFSCLLYKDHIVNKIPTEKILLMIEEAVTIEKELYTEFIPVSKVGLDANVSLIL
jgi:hypothetical protein